MNPIIFQINVIFRINLKLGIDYICLKISNSQFLRISMIKKLRLTLLHGRVQMLRWSVRLQGHHPLRSNGRGKFTLCMFYQHPIRIRSDANDFKRMTTVSILFSEMTTIKYQLARVQAVGIVLVLDSHIIIFHGKSIKFIQFSVCNFLFRFFAWQMWWLCGVGVCMRALDFTYFASEQQWPSGKERFWK